MPEFLILALIAGLAVAAVSGPLGCFVVWRRMAYFGDTLAHSALLGVVLGLLLEINISIAVAFCALVLALLLVFFQKQRELTTDTLLGILSHSSLALGLVCISLLPSGQVDLMGYLFGDLFAVDHTDIAIILGINGAVLGLLWALWNKLLAITLHEELAQVEGINVQWVRTALMLLMALVIAIAMKVVGVLLVTALLVIPAAASRQISQTPERMAINASLIGMLAVILGLTASWFFDTSAGPSIVLSCTLLFSLAWVIKHPDLRHK